MEAVQIKVHPDSLKELVVGNKKFRSAMDFRLSDYDLAICRNDYKETDVVRKDCLQKLRELLQNDGDITYRTDDAYLLRYLRYKKFDCKEAYKIIRNFYRVRRENPVLFYLPSSLDKFLKTNIGALFPYLTEEGNIIFRIKLSNWNVEELTLHDVLLGVNLVSDIVSMNPHSQVNGLLNLWDYSNVTIRHMACITHPRNARLWAKVLQELYPWRVKRVVFLISNGPLHATFVGIRYFLKKKIADRLILIRSDEKLLHKYINPAILPKEYGGSLDDSEGNTYFHRCLADNVKYLEYENSFIGVKRPEPHC